ncbi:hypothetical protein [Candidatus Nanohalobium constans]|uniref:Sulfatase N-terminal domain-containing protein n=1 Tax=Candidatus Nanohalobium constans TaxID=2565781 RepID=A0A5Q0UI96_9ARCH|nr:hypothetical protein [Candidatus Nanohalobium constans]QGA81061.1 hypothetical protein LC1Nh_1195 [Candidatus Nanohalobium constans]
MTQKQDIHGTDWDYLIILDACRYDYFRDNYEGFLEGDLKKVKSRGSATPEWLWNTFDGRRYNYNYISANPYINGQGLSLGDLVSGQDRDWSAADKFTNIVDSWIHDWDEEINTVRPEDFRKTAEENLDGSKTIIHFIQPHRPFISLGETDFDWAPKNKLEDEEESTLRKILDTTRPIWNPLFELTPYRFQTKVKEILGLGNNYEKLAREQGEEQVKQYYTEDLRLALEQVEKLVEQLEGKIIVTSDHGELLGEGGWGHSIGRKEKELVEVPWLEVKGAVDD